MPSTTYRTANNNDKFVWLITFVYFISMFMSLGQANVAVMFVCGLLFLVSTNYHFELKTFHLFVLQFCLFCYATAFWAMGYGYAIQKGNTILAIFIIMSIFYSYYERLPGNGVELLLKIMLYGSYTVVIYTIFFIGVGRIIALGEGSGRMGAGTNANTTGMIAATAILINAYFFMRGKMKRLMILIIPCIYIIAATQSRKALFMAVAGVIILYFVKNLREKKDNLIPVMKFLIVMGLIVGIFIYLSQTNLFSGTMARVNGMINSITGEGEVDSSTSKREFMRQVGWIQFSRTPLLGIGMGCARIILSKAMDQDGYLHCNYAELAADGGIVGLLSYYSIFIYLLINEMKYVKRDPIAPLILTLIILRFVTDWGMVSYYSKGTYFSMMVYFLHVAYCKRTYKRLR